MPDTQSLFGEATVYLADTSALITLENLFKMDSPVFLSIWEEIEDLMRKGNFKVLDYVEQEIEGYIGAQDALKLWVKKMKKHCFVETDVGSYNASIPIINSEYTSGFFTSKKLAEGKDEADPFLIGYCKTHNTVLITAENKTKPNKLPAVAKKHGVRCIDINEFLEERGMKMRRRED